MRIEVRNGQREAAVPLAQMQRLARQAVAALKVRGGGRLAITFIAAAALRRLNKRFLGHDWNTDVLSFRYDAAPGARTVVGEILISPKAAKTYAKRHGLAYQEELSRYVVHGLLHWLGNEDGTPAQQRRMRSLEDRLLSQCSA